MTFVCTPRRWLHILGKTCWKYLVYGVNCAILWNKPYTNIMAFVVVLMMEIMGVFIILFHTLA